jgi:hypothetical protein
MDNFLNFYNKYPWVAIVIVLQWLATAFVIIYTRADVTRTMGIAFIATIIFAYIGFKLPKG